MPDDVEYDIRENDRTRKGIDTEGDIRTGYCDAGDTNGCLCRIGRRDTGRYRCGDL